YSGIYNSVSSGTLASTYEVPISTIKRDVPLSDYEDPVSTLVRQEPIKTPSSPEFNPSAVYAQLEDLDTEVEPSKYPIEEIYDAGDIANVTLPPPIFLEDDSEDGVVNSLYFIQEEPEKEKMIEAGIKTDGASALYHTLEENENEQEKQIQRSATLSHKKHELKEKPMQRSATLMPEKSGTHSHGPMKKKPVYFTLESDGRKQPPKGNSYARKNTGIFHLPGDNETEIYGQIQQSSTPILPKSSVKLSTKIGSGQF
uniref:Uncharacterized protein n=1 Tax=Amphimedon queenslandica TaxID=400682 RepID=A0A1X7SFZ1_AMPQE